MIIQFIVILSVMILGAFVPGFARLFMYVVFFPIATLFFGCAIWIIGCVITGGEWMSMSGFTTAMMLGAVPSVILTMSVRT